MCFKHYLLLLVFSCFISQCAMESTPFMFVVNSDKIENTENMCLREVNMGTMVTNYINGDSTSKNISRFWDCISRQC